MRCTVTLIMMAFFVLTVPCVQAVDEIYMSEYVEGAGIKGPNGALDKAIELFNPSGIDIDLLADGYFLVIFENGAFLPTVEIALDGIIGAGQTFVIAHTGAAEAILAVADQTSVELFFDGNDAIVLMIIPPAREVDKVTVYLDIVGQVGFAPPIGCWCYPQLACTCNSVLSTLDAVLRHLEGPFFGFVIPNEPFFFDPTIWLGYPSDNFDGLGLPGDGEWIFKDGFESGDTSNWSQLAP